MIKKLRRKFVLVNMSLISLVLIIVFTSICYFSYSRMKSDSYRVMSQAVASDSGFDGQFREVGDGPPKMALPMIPVFAVALNADHEILSIRRDRVTVSDEMVAAVVQRVLASDRQQGTMLDLKLRYLARTDAGITRIAFADTSRELEDMGGLIQTLLMTGALGLGAFFGISLFLSGWALRPAEKAWEQQRQFVANASHELKTPLTVILANMGILLSRRQDTIGQQVKWIEYTQTEANRMKKLVEDLLFLAKSDGAQSPVPHIRLNLSELIWSCILPFESLAYEQGVEINSEIEPDVSLLGDDGQLKQLVMILLDNACKYAGEGGRVTLRLSRSGEQVRLTAANTGATIPSEQLEQIFERFYRLDSARSRDQGGYGLGLSIARVIVENHRGTISAASDEEVGTTFKVTFSDKHRS